MQFTYASSGFCGIAFPSNPIQINIDTHRIKSQTALGALPSLFALIMIRIILPIRLRKKKY